MILKTNKLYNMDCREGLKHLDDECIDSCIASPPYYGLRDYGIEPSVWDGDVDCEHAFGDWNNIKNIKEYSSGIGWDRPSRRESNNVSSNSKCVVCEKEFSGKIGQKFCSIKCLNTLSNDDRSNAKQKQQFCNKCGAWKGTLGLEPDFELYIKHLCDIYDGIKRVLKKTGTCWVNMGDTYSSKGGLSKPEHLINAKVGATKAGVQRGTRYFAKNNPIKNKCLMMIPQRFAIEMINRGWILRNVIIWHKPNCMPSSARDRFTVDFEYVYFFVKSNKTQYWIKEKTAQLVSKQPLGIKGIENSDWEWRECGKCLGTGIKHKKCKTCEGEGWIYNLLLQIEKCSYCKGLGRIRQDKECKTCKGKGLKKYNFWKGRQYFFEQQIDQSTTKFIYSRSSQKGDIQETNNPRKNWGKTKKELENEGYNSKYKNHEHGQTIQGFIRTDSIKEERDQSRIDAQNLFPNNRKKQQEYINHIHDHGKTSSQGRNKRTVWTIPTKPNPEAHFATFPPDLVNPMIKSGCPEYFCKKCGKPREKIYDITYIHHSSYNGDYSKGFGKLPAESKRGFKDVSYKNVKHIGYSDCGCNMGFKSGVVLDPFTGTGNTLLTAWKLGRDYIGFEISKEYCEIANKKLSLTKNIRLDKWIMEYSPLKQPV